MIVVENIYISDDILENYFVCDLIKCKGACCVEGESGAPLEKEELQQIEEVFEKVKPYLLPEGLAEIEKQGFFVEEAKDTFATPTINGKECVYAYYDDKGFLKCAFETAFQQGKINFPKPISCHLYPARLLKLEKEEAINYHRWHICEPACHKGASLKIPLYEFLKVPLIRKYGETWYEKLLQTIAEKHS